MTSDGGTHALLGPNRTGFELDAMREITRRSVDIFADVRGDARPNGATLFPELQFVAEFCRTPRKGAFGGPISPGDAVVINEFVRSVRPKALYEIGVASGYSSLFILTCMQRHGLLEGDHPAHLRSVDLLDRHENDPDRVVGQLTRRHAGDLLRHWELRTGLTSLDMHEEKPESRDGAHLAFVDGGHCHPWPVFDVFVLVSRLPPGSWILLQDVSLTERLMHDVIRFGQEAGYGFRGAEIVFEHYAGRKARGIEGCFNMAAVQVPDDPTDVLASLRDAMIYPHETTLDPRASRFAQTITQAS